MKVLGKDGYIPGCAMFFELTDEQLGRIRNNPEYYFDRAFVNECNYSKGDNAHIYSLASDGEDRFRIIYKHLKMLLANYKTVSWWDRTENKFIIKESVLCPKQSQLS